jgi:hypothetical protein
MHRHGPELRSPDSSRPRLARRALPGALAVLGSLVVLVLGGSGVALAGDGPDSVAAAGPGAGLGVRITRSSMTQATTPTTDTTGLPSESSQTLTTPTIDTTAAPPQSAAPPVAEGPLVVTMTASPQVAAVGQTVTYAAQVSGVPPGKHVRYDWAFSGGTATGQQVSRSYPDPGDYPVAVTVTVVSVAGLSGVASQLTLVASNTPSKVPGSGSPDASGSGSGTGKGGGHGSGNGSSSKSAAARAKRAKQAAAAAGVANPLAVQTPSAQVGDQVEGFLLTDAGAPFAPPVASTPTSASSASGGSAAGVGGAGGAAGVGGAIALTIAIVTLGALDERRRLSLRQA